MAKCVAGTFIEWVPGLLVGGAGVNEESAKERDFVGDGCLGRGSEFFGGWASVCSFFGA
jgi:hypothetical protein